VTFRGKVSVSALGAAVTWQYGPTTAYGTTSGPVNSSLLGIDQELTTDATGLAPATTYHVRAVAQSGLSVAYGRDVSFTTDRLKVDSSGSGSGTTAPAPSTTVPATTTTPTTTTTTTGTTPSTTTTTTTTTSGKTKDKDAEKEKDKDKDKSGDGSSTDTSGDDTSTDGGAKTPPGKATSTSTPKLGHSVAIAAVQGTIVTTSPAGLPVDLTEATVVPTGTVIDARAGTVELKTALDRKGATQVGRFWGGVFEVRQSTTARGLTRLVLRGGDFSSCASAASKKATASKATKKKQPARSLWGSDSHGRFQTQGRGSVATVRGTRWLTQDRCDGTLTRVVTGAVAVRDLRHARTITVARGHRYLARVAP
jgi:hypothetical protein